MTDQLRYEVIDTEDHVQGRIFFHLFAGVKQTHSTGEVDNANTGEGLMESIGHMCICYGRVKICNGQQSSYEPFEVALDCAEKVEIRPIPAMHYVEHTPRYIHALEVFHIKGSHFPTNCPVDHMLMEVIHGEYTSTDGKRPGAHKLPSPKKDVLLVRASVHFRSCESIKWKTDRGSSFIVQEILFDNMIMFSTSICMPTTASITSDDAVNITSEVSSIFSQIDAENTFSQLLDVSTYPIRATLRFLQYLLLYLLDLLLATSAILGLIILLQYTSHSFAGLSFLPHGVQNHYFPQNSLSINYRGDIVQFFYRSIISCIYLLLIALLLYLFRSPLLKIRVYLQSFYHTQTLSYSSLKSYLSSSKLWNGKSFFVNGWNAWSFCGSVQQGRDPPIFAMPNMFAKAFHDGGKGTALPINLGEGTIPIVSLNLLQDLSLLNMKLQNHSSAETSFRQGSGPSITTKGAPRTPKKPIVWTNKGDKENAVGNNNAARSNSIHELAALRSKLSVKCKRDHIASDMFTTLADVRGSYSGGDPSSHAFSTDPFAWTIGFLSQKQQFGCVSTNQAYDRLTVHVSGDGVLIPTSGGYIQTDRLVLYATANLSNPFEIYAELSCLENEVNDRLQSHDSENRVGIPTGWCSWYHFHDKINTQLLSENLNRLDEINRSLCSRSAKKDEVLLTGKGLKVFQIDDGYQSYWGDWMSLKKAFSVVGNGVGASHPLAQLAATAAQQSLCAGLWLAPFACDKDSKLANDHPDWILKEGGHFGNNACNSANCGKFFYGLDLTNPSYLEHLQSLIHTVVHDWGFRYLKLDFLYAGALLSSDGQTSFVGDRTLTRAQALRKALQTIVASSSTTKVGEQVPESIPDKAFIVGCGAPLGSAIGMVHANRISSDAGLSWEPSFPLPSYDNWNLPCAKNMIRNTITRSFMHGKWWINDPDCLMLRDSLPFTDNEVLAMATVKALSGGSLMISDDLKSISRKRLHILQKILPPSNQPFVAVDLMDREIPELLRLVLTSKRLRGARRGTGGTAKSKLSFKNQESVEKLDSSPISNSTSPQCRVNDYFFSPTKAGSGNNIDRKVMAQEVLDDSSENSDFSSSEDESDDSFDVMEIELSAAKKLLRRQSSMVGGEGSSRHRPPRSRLVSNSFDDCGSSVSSQIDRSTNAEVTLTNENLINCNFRDRSVSFADCDMNEVRASPDSLALSSVSSIDPEDQNQSRKVLYNRGSGRLLASRSLNLASFSADVNDVDTEVIVKVASKNFSVRVNKNLNRSQSARGKFSPPSSRERSSEDDDLSASGIPSLDEIVETNCSSKKHRNSLDALMIDPSSPTGNDMDDDDGHDLYSPYRSYPTTTTLNALPVEDTIVMNIDSVTSDRGIENTVAGVVTSIPSEDAESQKLSTSTIVATEFISSTSLPPILRPNPLNLPKSPYDSTNGASDGVCDRISTSDLLDIEEGIRSVGKESKLYDLVPESNALSPTAKKALLQYGMEGEQSDEEQNHDGGWHDDIFDDGTSTAKARLVLHRRLDSMRSASTAESYGTSRSRSSPRGQSSSSNAGHGIAVEMDDDDVESILLRQGKLIKSKLIQKKDLLRRWTMFAVCNWQSQKIETSLIRSTVFQHAATGGGPNKTHFLTLKDIFGREQLEEMRLYSDYLNHNSQHQVMTKSFRKPQGNGLSSFYSPVMSRYGSRSIHACKPSILSSLSSRSNAKQSTNGASRPPVPSPDPAVSATRGQSGIASLPLDELQPSMDTTIPIVIEEEVSRFHLLCLFDFWNESFTHRVVNLHAVDGDGQGEIVFEDIPYHGLRLFSIQIVLHPNLPMYLGSNIHFSCGLEVDRMYYYDKRHDNERTNNIVVALNDSLNAFCQRQSSLPHPHNCGVTSMRRNQSSKRSTIAIGEISPIIATICIDFEEFVNLRNDNNTIDSDDKHIWLFLPIKFNQIKQYAHLLGKVRVYRTWCDDITTDSSNDNGVELVEYIESSQCRTAGFVYKISLFHEHHSSSFDQQDDNNDGLYNRKLIVSWITATEDIAQQVDLNNLDNLLS